nr:immunoglobulin heavy chain junction region [Mus musculus]
CARTTRVMDYW